MRRATRQERVERTNIAYELRGRHSSAEAVRLLARRYALSPAQARRYVRAARSLQAPLPEVAIKEPITVRLPRPLVEQLRAQARATGRSLGSLVAQAIARFLSRGT